MKNGASARGIAKENNGHKKKETVLNENVAKLIAHVQWQNRICIQCEIKRLSCGVVHSMPVCRCVQYLTFVLETTERERERERRWVGEKSI